MWQLWIKTKNMWTLEGFYHTKETAQQMRYEYGDIEDYQICRVEV